MRVSGPAAEEYLQRMVSNDVAVLAPGESCDALLLTPKARVIAVLRVLRRAADDFLLLTEPELGEAVRAELLRFRFAARAEIELEEHRSYVLFGSGVEGSDGRAIPNPDYGVPALEILDGDVPEGATELSGDALEELRIRAGTPRFGREIDERVRAALAETQFSPRVFVAEWLEPPYSAGHWVPDMVEAARGTEVASMSGEPSHRMRWSDVAALSPDVVVLAPCGLDLDRTISEVMPLELSAHLLGTPAREEGRVFAVDANASFSQPGPRIVDGVELLAYLLHPEAYSDPGVPWSRIRV